MSDLDAVYITADPHDAGAELRCTVHPQWWADADGTDMPTAVKHVTEHFRADHREHVDSCLCDTDGGPVHDQRCIPPINWGHS